MRNGVGNLFGAGIRGDHLVEELAQVNRGLPAAGRAIPGAGAIRNERCQPGEERSRIIRPERGVMITILSLM